MLQLKGETDNFSAAAFSLSAALKQDENVTRTGKQNNSNEKVDMNPTKAIYCLKFETGLFFFVLLDAFL